MPNSTEAMVRDPRTTITKYNTANKKLYGLDHLRAVAIVLVFGFHYAALFASPEWLKKISTFGWTGVDLFFVLSGYLISSQLFAGIAKGEKISFPAFFLKRFFRIIPAYLLVVAIYFSVPAAREREAPAPLWKYLSFTQNLGLNLRTQGTFSHAWSLCIEEQFYLIFPLLLIALVSFNAFKRSKWLLLVLFLGGLAARWYVYDHIVAPQLADESGWATWYQWIYYPTYSRLDGLLSGVAIAALFRFRPLLKEKITRYGNLWSLISLLLLATAYWVCTEETSFTASVFGFPLLSIAYGLLVIGAISPSSLLYRFPSAITTKIAALSYAIYLTHKIIIHITQQQVAKLAIPPGSNRMLLICMITCFAGAWLMNKMIEQPFLKLRQKVLNKPA